MIHLTISYSCIPEEPAVLLVGMGFPLVQKGEVKVC